MMPPIDESWLPLLQPEFEKPYFTALMDFLRNEYATAQVFPPEPLIFNAFCQCPLSQVKVVILGQDPYHEPHQAHGLSFSVPDGVAFPPSLRNIFAEVHSDVGSLIPPSGNLTRWAQQGVLLLNATLTVRAHEAGSHQRRGWEQFTDAVIQRISSSTTGIVFILWGAFAQSKQRYIDAQRHLILTSAHPSPLSAYRGFFGNHHFSLTNEYLVSQGKEPINF